MNKTVKYTINGALIGGSICSLINVIFQQNNIRNNPTLKFDYYKVLISFSKGAVPGAVIGGLLGANQDLKLRKKFAEYNSISEYLEENIKNFNIDTVLIRKVNQLQDKIYEQFDQQLSSYPSLKGSSVRGTQIKGSDIDVEIKFNKVSGTISHINDIVENYFFTGYNDQHLIDVRKQKHSTGLTYKLYGKEYKVDVVVNREVENGKGDSYILRKSQSIFSKPKLIKTNSEQQEEFLRLTPKQRAVVQLLKHWKRNSDLKFPSIMLELIVKKSFIDVKMPNGLDKSFFKVIEYIGDNITTIRIVDPANSNNVISNSLLVSEKENIQELCVKMLADVRKNNSLILDYLPQVK